MKRTLREFSDIVKTSLKSRSGVSSKRLVLYVCVFTLVLVILVNLFGGFVPDHNLIYCLEGVIGICLGGMVMENRRPSEKTPHHED